MTFTLWFMGRPASGKSTIAKRTENRLRNEGIAIENLDGDDLRQNLHPDLGFSREDRALNNRRTAYIANLLNRNGIAVVIGMITPFRDAQRQAREIVEPEGDFVLIYVKCSVEECARRDPKDLYEQARAGKIDKFTGINHPFQEPHDPDIIVDTESESIEQSTDHVWERLQERGIIRDRRDAEGRLKVSEDEREAIVSRLQDLGYLSEDSDD